MRQHQSQQPSPEEIERRVERARAAVTARWAAETDRTAATETARRAARFARARQRIEKIVAGAPPLTDDQKAVLAAILLPGLGKARANAGDAA